MFPTTSSPSRRSRGRCRGRSSRCRSGASSWETSRTRWSAAIRWRTRTRSTGSSRTRAGAGESMSTDTATVPARRGEKLVGRVAFVTGGTRGIGAAICRSLASQGATIAAGYHSGVDRAEQLSGELEAHGVETSIHQGNVGSAQDCRRTVEEVIDRHGRLDILVNNAGITSDKTVLDLTDEDWYTVVAVNLSGAFFTSQAA